jgi:serine/threonine protein phosphatase PrpC
MDNSNSSEQVPCPTCGTGNRKEARFCVKCGYTLVENPAGGRNQSGGKRGVKKQAMGLIKRLDDQLERWLGPGKERSEPASPAADYSSQMANNYPSDAQIAATRARPRIPPKSIGDLLEGFMVLQVWPLSRSNYYQTCRTPCPHGIQRPPAGGRCDACRTDLPPYLLHETILRPFQNGETQRKWLIDVGRLGIPGVLKPLEIIDRQETRYLLLDYPHDPWQSLFQFHLPPSDLQLAINWCLDLGQALVNLAEQNLTPKFPTLAELFESVVVVQNKACYADLTYFDSVYGVPRDELVTGRWGQALVQLLGQVLYTLTSGKFSSFVQAPNDAGKQRPFGDVPAQFQNILERARRNEISNPKEFLAQLNSLGVRPSAGEGELGRGLRQISGYTTNVGKVRDHNEDFVGKYSLGMQQAVDAPEVGLYMVADGMGGHQAGEQASKEVVREVLGQAQEKIQALQSVPRLARATLKLDETITPGEVLIAAIQKANGILYQARRSAGSDRGTTITAALVVGDTCAIANVGDSRTYLYHNGKLEQVTQDHSLVASLVAAKMIKPEDVRKHPQRSSILRSLGEGPSVQVDVFHRSLVTGDRLLLCSDGLWEMVLDGEIERIVRQATNPQAACDLLIQAANHGGGEDNVSVIIVWIE